MVVRCIISTCHFLYGSIRYAGFMGLRLLTKLMSLIFSSCKLILHFFLFFSPGSWGQKNQIVSLPTLSLYKAASTQMTLVPNL